MRFLTGEEAWPLIAKTGFVPDLQGNPYPGVPVHGTRRIEAEFTSPAWSLSDLADELISWLPGNSDRFLWLANWFGPGGPPSSPYSAFQAARTALGAKGEVIDARVCHFDQQSWSQDELAVTPEDGVERSVLIGMLVMLIPADWDAWILSSTSTDAVEIWERNVLFHTADAGQAAKADRLIARFGLARWPERRV